MSRAWVLPEHIADILPAQARRIEAVRRRFLDHAARRGFELVIPPLLEHLDSLLSGTGRELDLRTFKLADQLSGRTLGLRADTTPQAARIDAHLLNRDGVTRLCYCGPVLHTRPAGPGASREPLQFGAELFGHGGLEADLEVQELAIDALAEAGLSGLTIDLADARVLGGVLTGLSLDPGTMHEIAEAVSRKDSAALSALAQGMPTETRDGLLALLKLYGGFEALDRASALLPPRPLIRQALEELRWLASHLQSAYPTLRVGFDLADMGGYAYYSGPRFSLYGGGMSDALARGGRYDEVGAVFGRNRPAVGFSLDLKMLTEDASGLPAPGAVRAAWSEDPALRALVRRLREEGETVIYDLPGQPTDDEGRRFDRELAHAAGRWVLRAI